MLSGPSAIEQPSSLTPSRRLLLSIVVPVYNEEAVLEEFHRRISLVCDQLEAECELIYVNDGSRDNSLAIMRQLHGWQEGFDMVFAQRMARSGETLVKRAMAYAFYRLIDQKRSPLCRQNKMELLEIVESRH